MKFRYPIGLFISGIAIAAIAKYALPENLVDTVQGLCVFALVISKPWFICVVIWKICQKIRQASLNTVRAQMQHQQTSKMQDIERELDEIEASLDAISEAENSDGKIIPIWNSKPPER